MKKRSIRIAGHATSLSLENEFWAELEYLAKSREVSLATLVTEIDTARQPGNNLASALRVHILMQLKTRTV